jgi:hypothetical protein
MGARYERIVDSGKIILTAGSSRSDAQLKSEITLRGKVRVVPFNRVMRTPVTIS